MPDLFILFSIWMKLLSFDIVNFGFPQSLENMVYDFISFKLFSNGYKHVSSTYSAISPSPRREWGGGGGIAQLIPLEKKLFFQFLLLFFYKWTIFSVFLVLRNINNFE